jgi:hypothetical protein
VWGVGGRRRLGGRVLGWYGMVWWGGSGRWLTGWEGDLGEVADWGVGEAAVLDLGR